MGSLRRSGAETQSCVFHAPCPAPPEPSEGGTAPAATPSNNNTTTADGSAANVSQDSNVTCREIIVREWRSVGETAATSPAAAATSSSIQTSTGDAPASTNPGPTPNLPVMFTIEEFEAQERLLAHFRQTRDRQAQRGQRGQRGAGRRRPRVRFESRVRVGREWREYEDSDGEDV
ncbi:hypothetical protein J7T55_011288 [Diaporthe amygdali]|uniref:uncharacterized protein n=1 Tax=Phomopsis amygdali TaxID=1214568 RepID=UPI0022FEDCB3|nr:uncharacterized protein J7T55_011288 [Diaporthe amygdali]KAJ0108797.1 hypothetical protein J7T55_011288 [Diaporthe amygdali]